MATARLTRGNLHFILGFALGITVSLLMTSFMKAGHPYQHTHSLRQSTKHLRVRDVKGPFDLSGHDPLVPELLEGIHGDAAAGEAKFEELESHHDDDTVAKEMASRVRVLVWVMTGPQNLDTKAIHVRNTWGKRANKLLFMSSKWNSTFPTIGLNVSEGREHLTAKSMQAFRYVYEHHLDDADWFMKADDDTYVIMENLRYLLSSYSSEDPIYFGHIFNPNVDRYYASGGAGYVLSKESMRRMITKGMQNATLCRPDGGPEDVAIGKCLKNIGVKLLPSTDRLGRSRFHCFGPEGHLKGDFPRWYYAYDVNGAKKGIGNISDYPVSFHYVGGTKMYTLEYFVYHLRPFGIISRVQHLNLN